MLGAGRVGRHDNFFTLGGDSILAIQVITVAGRAGLSLTPKTLFQNPTVAQLAAAVTPTATGVRTDQEPVTGPLPATPIQAWFLALDLPNPHHFNQSLLLAPAEPLDVAALDRALRDVTAHHDALRQRLTADGTLTIDAPDLDRSLLTTVDLSGAGPEELRRHARRVQTTLNLHDGPTVAALHVTLGPTEQRLFITAHHLVVDGVSWRILLEDLVTAYRGHPLPPRTSSYRAWAEHLAEHAGSAHATSQIPYWRNVLTSTPASIPHDRHGGANRYRSGRTLSLSVPLGEHRAAVQTRLLNALADTLRTWTGRPHTLIDIENHGRHPYSDSIDLTRTVGWFTVIHPLRLGRADNHLDTVPDHGVTYTLLRDRLPDTPRPVVCFNYLGQVDQSFRSDGSWRTAPEEVGLNQDPAGRRPYELEVVALVADGQLHVRFVYSSELHDEATIRRLAAVYREALLDEAPAPQAVDFPLAGLDDEELAGLLAAGDVEDIYRLSPMQEGMLFHTVRNADTGSYVVQMAGRFDGPIDPSLFQSAWSAVVSRHPALRTSFHWADLTRPVQVVRRGPRTPVVVLDWRAHQPAEQDAMMSAFLLEDRARGFALTAAPLIRLTLVRLGDEAWQLVWTHHHLLVDGWSMPLVVRELLARYAALRDARLVVPPPATPYRDYVAWLDRQDRAAAQRFWGRRLAGFAAATRLPAELRPRAGRTPGYGTVELRLGGEASIALGRFARSAGITVSSVVNAAWAVLLARHSDERDVVFGVTVAGRPADLPGAERMVGLLINTLPARITVPDGEPVGRWLREVHTELLEMQEYAYAPLTQIQACGDVPRGDSLFDSIVVFENYPTDDSVGDAVTGVRTEQVHAEEQTDYPLTLSAAYGEQLFLALQFATDRYTPETGRTLLEQLVQLLGAMLGDPDQPVGRISPVEVRGSAQPPGVEEPVPCPPLLHRLIERHAAGTPDAVAIVDGDRQVTYGRLNARANRMARVLRSHGVGPERTVGLVLARSVEFVVAAVATLKAGGGYLPVDPTYPAPRQQALLAGAWLVLTDDDAPTVATGAVLSRSRVLAEMADREATNLTEPGTPDRVAYTIFTSGSTGVPKGVQLSHRNLAHAVAAWQEAYELRSDDRHLQMANATFDVCTGDLGRALGSGATLVLCPREVLLDPAALASLADTAGVTCAEFVPVVLRHLFEGLLRDDRRLTRIRLLICGSDRWPVAEYEQAARAVPRATVINSYGLTEVTVDSSLHVASPALPYAPDALMPIGVPLGRNRLHVLDAAGRPTDAGVSGELYVGGPQVGRGYLVRPALTAERFVPDPFGPPGSRLYRTGDRARRLADGEIEFLGRLDHQLKLRGHRIEPVEVESVLRAHDAVAAAVVTIHVPAAAEPQLVAYVVPTGPVGPDLAEQLRARAAGQLPGYMVPAAVVLLDRLPVTPHGKLDLAALPAPAAPDRDRPAPSRATTPAEQVLARVWSDLLGVAEPGPDDNFFALGGDSIVCLQLVSRVRQAGWAITPRQVFELRSLRELAGAALPVDPAGSGRAGQGPVTGEAPLTPVQASLLVEQDLAAPHHYNQAVMLRLRTTVRADTLAEALRGILRHHDALRLRFAPAGSTWRQDHAGVDEIPADVLRVVDLTAVPAHRRSAVVEHVAALAQASLDLAAGRLLRAVLFRMGADGPDRLLLVIHHLAVDGVSWRIILEDLRSAYDDIAAGGPARLAPKTTAFREWARHLKRRAASAEIDGEIGYWLSVLRQGAQTALVVDHLPEDDHSVLAANTRASLRIATGELDATRTLLLLREVPAAYRSDVAGLLLTAVTTAITEWTGDREVMVDVEGHGRADVEGTLDLSRTVGWFTSVHPVFLTVPPGDVRHALRRVDEQLRRVPHRGIGYGLLRYLRDDPDTDELRKLPPAAISFNYLGQLDQSFDLHGMWEPAAESEGPGQDLDAPRPYLLEIDGMVLGGRLRLSWSFSDRLFSESTVRALAGRSVAVVEQLIDRRSDADAARERGAENLSDVPLTQRQLDDLLAGLGS